MTTKKKTDDTLTAEEAVEQEFLQKQVGDTDANLQAVLEEVPPEAEQRNIYEYQMSSTETALCSPEDFWILKLHS